MKCNLVTGKLFQFTKPSNYLKKLSESLENPENSREVFYDTSANTLDYYVPLKKRKLTLIMKKKIISRTLKLT